MTNLAFVFPGQGSQSIGMLADLAEQHVSIINTFDSVSEKLGFDVWHLVQEGPDAKLNQTENTQVAMLTADVAIFRLLQEKGIQKSRIMAGHSLGEYAALVCASAISLPNAAKLVAMRGRLMQETVPAGQGAMAAIIGLNDEQVEEICHQASNTTEKVTPANFNSIEQIVIAGHTPAVERAIKLGDEAGARLCKIIPVSVPCHCPLLENAAHSFAEYLAIADFKEPDTAVISNVDLSIYKKPEQIRALLKEQLFKPVRWVETIRLMQANGVQSLIECGPGKVLNGLVKRIDKTLTTFSVYDNASLEQAISHFASHQSCCS